ncbi:uncharacterized protein LOC126839230 isoform X2 [Adelges cooleyi]|uniref:uncharacterized protein LOC126839230 isoform X2 n=1 Tax=Adelges cooleyi TaxID=133065 RepID=UPI00218032CF|nr:uncharacterized protein LOC126839230 isoform X2 [Adelges cooleyi]
MESIVLPTRTFVNGSYLQKFVGKPITLIGSILKVNSNGMSVTLQSTDNQVVTATFHEPIDSCIDGWLEVHGFVQDKATISGDNYFNLPSSITNDFDKNQFDETVGLISNLSNPLK